MTRIYCAQIKLTKKVCNHNPLEKLGERWITRDVLRLNSTQSAPRRRCQSQRIQTSPRSESQTHSSSQSSLNKEENRSQDIATGRNIVVAVDASEDSVCAFKWTVANLYRQGDFLHIVHVVPDYLHTSSTPGPGSIFYPGASLDEDQEHDLEEQAQDFIQEFFVADAARKGIAVNVVLVRDYRHLGKAVCKKAEELEAAPLVLAAHHKNAFEEMMLGSISKFCATHCKRPVLLVHPEHSMI